MTRFGAGLTGAVTGFALALSQVMLLAETTSPFLHYGWWMWLMSAAAPACGLGGCALGLCISAYGDLRRTVNIEVEFGLPERVP